MVRYAAANAVALRAPRLTGISLPDHSANGQFCLAIDIGGTKLAIGLVDAAGAIVWQDRIRTPRATDPVALFRVIDDLVEIAAGQAAARGEVVACGVGCGGPMGPGGETVSPLNIPAWRDFPLRDRLVRSLDRFAPTRQAPIRVDNDAKAFALGEGWIGAAQKERNFLAMVVSTGIGGGIVLDGRLLHGQTGNAGHIGHVIVEPAGRVCACGARGCLEAEASGTGIAAATGEPAEQASSEVVERTGRLVGRAVGSVANLLDLKVAVVGGGVALGFGTRFFLAAQRELQAVAQLDHSRGCRIEPAGLGASSPLIGAAALGWPLAVADTEGRAGRFAGVIEE
jgi:glucokinase